MAALGVAAGMEAIDLCCGDGLFTVALATIARRVVAIDLDPAMLKRARVRFAGPNSLRAPYEPPRI
jgi:ubiquinone/menaquinone biosynthesis C-methylase UbiE